MKFMSRPVALGAIALGLVSTAGYFTTANATLTEASQPPLLDLIANRPEGRQPGMGPGSRPGRGDNPEQMFEQLNLTPAQLSQIRAIREASRATMQPLREQMRAGHQELRTLMASDASTDEIRQRHSALMTLDQQLRTQRFEVMLQIRDVLTPEQRAELAQLLEQRRSQQRQSNFGPSRPARSPAS